MPKTVSQKRDVVCSPALDYFGAGVPFSFVCNNSLDAEPWTPTRLKDVMGIHSLAGLQSITALVTACNLDSLMEIVEEWNDKGFSVALVFPCHRCKPEPCAQSLDAFGVPVDECYEAHKGGFRATSAFRDSVRQLFKSDKLVSVED